MEIYNRGTVYIQNINQTKTILDILQKHWDEPSLNEIYAGPNHSYIDFDIDGDIQKDLREVAKECIDKKLDVYFSILSYVEENSNLTHTYMFYNGKYEDFPGEHHLRSLTVYLEKTIRVQGTVFVSDDEMNTVYNGDHPFFDNMEKQCTENNTNADVEFNKPYARSPPLL